jgi:hypothetical protein
VAFPHQQGSVPPRAGISSGGAIGIYDYGIMMHSRCLIFFIPFHPSIERNDNKPDNQKNNGDNDNDHYPFGIFGVHFFLFRNIRNGIYLGTSIIPGKRLF